jgi:hypothetical protein
MADQLERDIQVIDRDISETTGDLLSAQQDVRKLQKELASIGNSKQHANAKKMKITAIRDAENKVDELLAKLQTHKSMKTQKTSALAALQTSESADSAVRHGSSVTQADVIRVKSALEKIKSSVDTPSRTYYDELTSPRNALESTPHDGLTFIMAMAEMIRSTDRGMSNDAILEHLKSEIKASITDTKPKSKYVMSFDDSYPGMNYMDTKNKLKFSEIVKNDSSSGVELYDDVTVARKRGSLSEFNVFNVQLNELSIFTMMSDMFNTQSTKTSDQFNLLNTRVRQLMQSTVAYVTVLLERYPTNLRPVDKEYLKAIRALYAENLTYKISINGATLKCDEGRKILVRALNSAKEEIKKSGCPDDHKSKKDITLLDGLIPDEESYVRGVDKQLKRKDGDNLVDIVDISDRRLTCKDLGIKYGDKAMQKLKEQGYDIDKDGGLDRENCVCRTIYIKCLVENKDDPAELMRCIQSMDTYDMFKVGKEQLKDAHPNAILLLVKALKIQIKKNRSQIKHPEPYNEWINRSPFKDLLTGESTKVKYQQFANYVKAVISFLMENPAILNENYNGQSIEQEIDPNLKKYLESVGRDKDERYWQGTPDYNTAVGKQYAAKFAIMSMSSPSFGVPTYGTSIPLYNVSPFQRSSGMYGGGPNALESKYELIQQQGNNSSSLLYHLFNKVLGDLNNVGLELDDCDKEIINNSIAKIHEFEKKLDKLRILLNALVTARQSCRDAGCTEQPEKRTISLENVVSNQDSIDFLYNNIDALKECMSNTGNNTNALCNRVADTIANLVKKVGENTVN